MKRRPAYDGDDLPAIERWYGEAVEAAEAQARNLGLAVGDLLITVEKAASLTGFSARTIYNWISSAKLTSEYGLVPGSKRGSRVRLRRDAFLAWVEAGRP